MFPWHAPHLQNGHQYEAAFNEHYENFTAAELGAPLIYGQACYDATWILALALNNTLTGMQLIATWYIDVHRNI